MLLVTVTFSELLGIGGVVAGLAAIVVAVLIARRRPQLVFAQEGNVVVEGTDPEITISWRDIKVPAVSRTRITTWNAGAKTFEGSAVVRNYPLRYLFPGADQILAVTVLGRSNEENSFNAEAATPNTTPASVVIEFDYLDPRQGAVIEVLHTSDRWGVQPAGTVKGIRKPLTERAPDAQSDAVALFAMTILVATIGVLSILRHPASSTDLLISGSLVALMVFLVTGTFYLRWRSRPPAPLRLSTKSETIDDTKTD